MTICRAVLAFFLSISFLTQDSGVYGQAEQATHGEAGNAERAGRIYVDGINYPLTQAGIQRALNDACVRNRFGTYGTEVLLPPMVIYLSHKSGEQFLETCSLQIRGAGLYSTWFVVDENVPEDVPYSGSGPCPPVRRGPCCLKTSRSQERAAAEMRFCSMAAIRASAARTI